MSVSNDQGHGNARNVWDLQQGAFEQLVGVQGEPLVDGQRKMMKRAMSWIHLQNPFGRRQQKKRHLQLPQKKTADDSKGPLA
jgi:hypothetical protein